jgi:uncharacterized BrkB/YihY/UPF0761 family membrane protein
MQTEVHVYAFSVAANVLLSFFPFLIVTLSISRLVFGDQAAVSAIDLALRDYFPDSLGQFLRRNLPRTGPVEVVSILLLLFTANGIFEPLEVALNRVWGIRKNRSFFRNQIVSLGLIFICGSLALGSMLVTALNQQSFNMGGPAPLWLQTGWLQNMVGGGAGWISLLIFKLAAIPIAVLVLFLIYRYLPNGRPPLNRVIPAAISVGLLMELLKYINTLAWPGFQRKLANEYGVFQYSVTLIFLGFLASMVVLAGAEWSARGHKFDEVKDAETPAG